MRKHYLLLILASGLYACSSGSSSSSTTPATVQYNSLSAYPESAPGSMTLVTGVRRIVNIPSNAYVTAIYYAPAGAPDSTYGVIFDGPEALLGKVGNWHLLSYPSSSGTTVTATAFYGPNNGSTESTVQIAGNYNTLESGSQDIGLLYQGPTDGSGTWQTLIPPSPDGSPVINTIAHSTMGGLVVGNYDTMLATGKAFIYDMNTNTYYNLVKDSTQKSITAYGIWYNGGTSYTIAGGYSNADFQGITNAYIVDWDSATHIASNWKLYNYKNQQINTIISHFEGITTDGAGGYNLAADAGTVTNILLDGGGTYAAFVHVARIPPNGAFGVATWTDIIYPGAVVTSANTVNGHSVLGVYSTTSVAAAHLYSYIATVIY